MSDAARSTDRTWDIVKTVFRSLVDLRTDEEIEHDRKLRAAVANLRACAEVLRKARRGAEIVREAERAADELEGMLR